MAPRDNNTSHPAKCMLEKIIVCKQKICYLTVIITRRLTKYAQNKKIKQ